MYAPPAHALDDLGVVHVHLDDVIDCDAGVFHRFGLGNGAREPVEEKTVGAIRLTDAVLHQSDDDLVRHETARVHDLLGFEPEGCTGLHRGPQHVTGGDLRDAVLLRDESGLGALACAGCAEQDQAKRAGGHGGGFRL